MMGTVRRWGRTWSGVQLPSVVAVPLRLFVFCLALPLRIALWLPKAVIIYFKLVYGLLWISTAVTLEYVQSRLNPNDGVNRTDVSRGTKEDTFSFGSFKRHMTSALMSSCFAQEVLYDSPDSTSDEHRENRPNTEGITLSRHQESPDNRQAQNLTKAVSVIKRQTQLLIEEPLVNRESKRLTEEELFITKHAQNLTEAEPLIAKQTHNLTKEEPLIARQTHNLTEEEFIITKQSQKLTEEEPFITRKSRNLIEEELPIGILTQNLTEEKPLICRRTHNLTKNEPLITKQVYNLTEEGFIINRQTQNSEQNESVINRQTQHSEQNESVINRQTQHSEQNEPVINRQTQHLIKEQHLMSRQIHNIVVEEALVNRESEQHLVNINDWETPSKVNDSSCCNETVASGNELNDSSNFGLDDQKFSRTLVYKSDKRTSSDFERHLLTDPLESRVKESPSDVSLGFGYKQERLQDSQVTAINVKERLNKKAESSVDNPAKVVMARESWVEELQDEHKSDSGTSFLRAARAGQLDKVLQLIEQGVDINTSNANGLNALHLAAKDGHTEIVEELLSRGCNVDAATRKGNTALHIAALAGQEEVARALVGAGAQVNAQSSSGFTPLYMASQEGHHAVVSFLLSKGANQGLSTEDGFTPLAVAMQQGHDKVVAVLLENDSRGKVRLPALHIAAKKDDTKAATLLLQNDHNPDVTSKSGFTPLHIAAHYGNQNIANLLLQKGADINFAAKHNITPLHVACKWGKSGMVGLLVDRGANIECRTRDGLTPLHCAARSGHEQVVEQLIEAKAPLAAKTKNGLSALHMAAQGDHVEAARVLLYHSAPVDDITVDYLTALHVAAHCGHVPIARLLLERKADANARALNGFTPLHIACKKNRVKVVELLLKYGAKIESTTESGLTGLHVSCFMGCLNIAALLLNAGASPDPPTVRGETPLHLAARANQSDLVRLLLRHNASVDAKAREDQTPLHVASRLGNTDIAALLLDHGADPRSATSDLYTPLHIAAKENQLEIAKQLIDHGANLDAATKKGFTPLHLASKYGNLEIARLLLDKQAPIDAQGKNGVTPLHVASHYDKESICMLLLEKGASPHATAKNGFTPLHISAKKNQMDIGRALLQYGGKPNAESKAGFTPLHLAAQEGHDKFAAMLLEHGADPNHHSKNGLTPLHLCAQEDKVNVATVLGQHGAEINATTKGGYTPLHVACHYGQVGMVRWLVNQSAASVNSVTKLGYSPLHQAAQQGHSLVITILLKAGADPNAQANNGLTALAIANKLGYITVIETLKEVTTVTTTTVSTTVTTTTHIEERYKVVAPEAMQETFMSDSEDDTGEDVLGTADHHHYRYMAGEEMKSLKDDSARDFHQDDHDHYRESYVSNSDVMAEMHVKEKFALNTSQPDNVDIVRTPVHVGKGQWTNFLVSFLVDARGGAMRGCRRSGINIVVPPKSASAPIRLTCRYLRNRPGITPPLSEAQALATRVLEFSPAGTVFLGPIIIEVPHFVSLRGRERELVVMRSEDGTTWREQALEGSESAVQDILNTSFEGDRVLRVVTSTLPQYLAVVSRLRQEVHAVGPEGGVVASTAVADVQAVFPPNALTKKIKVALQAQPISSELVNRMFGNRAAASAIVTVEPRRRKFHKPITLSLPLPTPSVTRPGSNYTGDNPSLRLLCSITGGNAKAQWEDVTGSTPLTVVEGSVSFTTTVSARFWLLDCRPVSQASAMASQLYHEAAHVPFMAKFVVYAKRIDRTEAALRIFIMTDDREEKTLEHQENFIEVAKSRDVEVVEGKPVYVECLGNLIPVTKSGEQASTVFTSFKENRICLTVRLKDPDERPHARLLFMSLPRGAPRSEPPVCTLNITIPDSSSSPGESGLIRGDVIMNDELCLRLGDDWEPLARYLGLTSHDIEQIERETNSSPARANLALKLFYSTDSTGKRLESGLEYIGRHDLLEFVNRGLVMGSTERAIAELTLDSDSALDQSGFDSLATELKTHDSERIERHLEAVKEVPCLEKDSNMDIMYEPMPGKYEWEEKNITADFLAHESSQPTAPLNGTNGFEPGEWKNGKTLWRSPSSEGIRDDCVSVERGQLSSDSESGVLMSGSSAKQQHRQRRRSTTAAGSSSGSDVALHEGLSDSEHGSDLQESLPHNGSHSEINQVMVLP